MSELPKGWVEVTLGELGFWQGGGTPDKSNAAYWSAGNIPWVSPKDMKRFHISEAEDQITEAALSGSSANLVAENSVLLVTRSGILKHTLPVALTGRDVAINQDIKALTPHPGLDPLFIAQQIKSLGPFVLKNCTKAGTTVDSVDFNRLKAVIANIAPLAEQKRIVAKLDALNAKSARARTELARIETLVSRYKQAVLSKAFSGELTTHLRKPSCGNIQVSISDPFTYTQSAPASWTRYLFSDVCTIIGGSQPPKETFAYAPQEGYIRLVQIRDYKSDAKATYIPRELARRFCSSTDIMIGRYGPPIFQILRGIDGAYNVALMKAEPTEAVAPDFLFWYLHHPVLFRYVEIDSKRTSGQDGVNKAHLERWPILLPPLEEQHEIVRRIEFAFAKIDRLAAEAKRALALVGKLDEAIFAKAFRGELVPQDESDEPAEKLLERIRAERAAAPKAKRGRGS